MGRLYKPKADTGHVIRQRLLGGEWLFEREADGAGPSETDLRRESQLINEISLVLSEKRTNLSIMRTGIAILALPISVLSVLVAISRYYEPARVMMLLAPLLAVCAVLTVLGFFLVIRSLRRIGQLNGVITGLKEKSGDAPSPVVDEVYPSPGPQVRADRDF